MHYKCAMNQGLPYQEVIRKMADSFLKNVGEPPDLVVCHSSDYLRLVKNLPRVDGFERPVVRTEMGSLLRIRDDLECEEGVFVITTESGLASADAR